MLILLSLAVIGRVVICQDCFFKSSLYIGHINKTIDNVTCDSWNSHLSHSDPLALNLPDASLSDASNYCRDPDVKGHPWCYVDRDPHYKSWEFCDVPFCRECYFANRSHDYNGYVTTSINGKCLAWTGTSFPDSSFPDGSVTRANNYCRDPDNRGYPHCPTSRGFLPCLIPKCNDSVCADDPSTLCESLKFVICGVKDMALKLCPKTCRMCATCEDNPMAKCDTLKQFICGNAQAAQLCPKTCNLCSARSTIGVTSMISTTRTISTLTPTISQDICVDLANFSCNNPEIKALICIDVPAATNFCRKTCNLCDKAVVKIAKDQCGDPIKVSMCRLLQEEVCLCSEHTTAVVLCPRYCSNLCGPVNRTVRCLGPTAEMIIGRL